MAFQKGSKNNKSHHKTHDFVPKKEQYKAEAAVWARYLENKSGQCDERRVAIMKRIFLTLNDAHIAIKPQGCDAFLPPSSRMPLASMLSHGGRVVIEVPRLRENQNENEFINWVLGGELEQVKKDGVIMGRSAATHSLTHVEENGELRVKELHIKPTPKNAKEFIVNARNKRHLGMNVGLGSMQTAEKDNGENGHLYMFWLPPTNDMPGALMVGCEGSEPGKTDRHGHKHGPSGKSPNISPTGSSKFRALRKEDKRVPADIDGMRAVFRSDKELKKLMAKSAESFHLFHLRKPIRVKRVKKQGNPVQHFKNLISTGATDDQKIKACIFLANTPHLLLNERVKKRLKDALDGLGFKSLREFKKIYMPEPLKAKKIRKVNKSTVEVKNEASMNDTVDKTKDVPSFSPKYRK